MDTLLNFHLVALRGALKEMETIVPDGDDEDFKTQLKLLRDIRKNIKAHRKQATP